MKTKLKRSQIIACAGLGALAIVVAAAGFLLVVSPQQSKASRLDAEIAATQAKLATLHGRSRGPAIRAADLFQLARALPMTADMPGIVLGLARAATSSSVKLTAIQPVGTSVVQSDGALAYPVKVVVDGSWGGVTQFMRDLRLEVRVNGAKLNATGRLFVVDNVQIATGTGTSEVEATLNVNAFTYGVLPPPTDTTSTDTSSTTTTSSSGGALASGSTG